MDHGVISKGVPKGMIRAAGKHRFKMNPTAKEKGYQYANQRLTAHKQGRLAATRVPHLFDTEVGRGLRARQESRLVG